MINHYIHYPDTYPEAKRRLVKFCETSATETEELLTSKPRVRVPKRKYSSSEEETSVISTLNKPNSSLNVKSVNHGIIFLLFEIYMNRILFMYT